MTDSHDLPTSEAKALAKGGISYFRTLHLFFSAPEDLGKRIEARAWDGISKPMGTGATSAAVATLVFWLIGVKEKVGKFPVAILEIVKDWPFCLSLIGLIVVLQLGAKRSISFHTTISQVYALIYSIAFFVLPFAAIIVLASFFQKLLSLSEWPTLLSMIAIAPLAGYTVIFGLTRVFAGVLSASYEFVFWVFIVYGIAVVKFADHFFPLWQFK